MLTKYFDSLQKKLLKKKNAASDAKGSKKIPAKIDKKEVMKAISGIIPSHLTLGDFKPIDENGFSPEGSDFLIFKNYCPDIASLMGGYIPLELIYASCFVIPSIDKKHLADTLNRVMSVKRINKYSNASEEESFRIPAFIIAGNSGYGLRDIKNDALNFYRGRNADEDWEFDILMMPGSGIIVKDWREKKHIALETGADSMMWFFILMNEYLDIARNTDMDFRKYVSGNKNYTEY